MSLNLTDQEINKEREIALKFSKEYDYAYCKEKMIEAPCNIWGYINHLEQRIQLLEEKLKSVK